MTQTRGRVDSAHLVFAPRSSRTIEPRRAFLRQALMALPAMATGVAPLGLPTRSSAGGAGGQVIADSLVPRRNPSLSEKRTESGLLVFTRDTAGHLVGTVLPPGGERVWALVDGSRSVGGIIRKLQRAGTPEAAARVAVARELGALAEAGIVYFGRPVWELIRYR